MRSASISLPLNFFVFPFGYLYLKDSRRFVVGGLYVFFQAPLFSLLSWLNPKFFPAWLNAPIIFAVGGLVTAFILIDTYRLTRRGGSGSTWPVFTKPHAFWFIPVYLIATGTALVICEPWEKPFARSHNIPSPSMEPNMQLGDFIFVDYITGSDSLKRADIVAYQGSGTAVGKTLMHRIIGVPGDRILVSEGQVPGSNNRLIPVTRIRLNGKPVPLLVANGSKYKLLPINERGVVFREGDPGSQYDVLEGEHESPLPDELRSEIVLGPNQFFLMGDNRDHSYDSRFAGVVSRDRIVGKYMHTYFSFYIPNPECEFNPPLLFSYRVITHSKNQPCGSVSIRWEKAGYVAR
jgi:signal peptidase I